MADTILQLVLDNLNSLIQNELGLLQGFEKEMDKLCSTLSTIQAVLEDAEEKQLKDKALQNWLRKLKDAAYELDDILDECKTEASRFADDNKVHASHLTCFLPNVILRHKIGSRMKDAREKLDGIAEERRNFHLRETVADRRVLVIARRETSSVVTQPEVYGREEDKEKVVVSLVEDVANSDNISIYPIVGIGGLGKTTLAQLVFNDERIKTHFELRVWVFVSEDFYVKRLIAEIITSLGGYVDDALNLDLLQRRLKDILNEKRCLLVLDDVWNEDQEKWDQLKYTLTCGSKGSSVIVTTRLAKVASIVGTLPMHPLSALSEDDCWSLFKQRAFGNNAEQPMNILAIAKEIVKKCKGVPLAAKTLGSLMRFKSNENEWLHVKDSELWNLPQDENSILPALKLSYSNLPTKLRQCFSYCAVFPKNFKIKKERLIHLWMANGFISSSGTLDAEDVGNEVFNELYWRFLIQDFVQDDPHNTGIYKMHDLVHDLAQSVVEDECRVAEFGRPIDHLSRRTLHVTFTFSKDAFTIPDTLYRVQFLRTLSIQPTYPLTLSHSGECEGDFSKFLSLRALELTAARLMKLSPSIGNLKHLRYLEISQTRIEFLPKSLCSLWNLQILKLERCSALQQLPQRMRRLKNLRHLYIEGCSSLTSMPPKVRQMTALKTLPFFIVGKRRGYRLAELRGLNLSGRLHIKNLERVGNPTDAGEACLRLKQNLRNLSLFWESDGESELHGNSEMVLEALEPHPNLEELDISGYNGISFPHWLCRPVLTNVVSMCLKNFHSCLQLPPLGKLPSLKHLSILGMKHVKYVENYFHGEEVEVFQSLESISIDNLPSLEKLSIEKGRNTLPCLTRMSISECPKLVLPCLPSVTELTIRNSSEVSLSSISNLNNLTELWIDGNDEVMKLKDSFFLNLSSLQSLSIRGLTKLEVLPTDLRSLSALESLYIHQCHELASLPEQGLRCLNSLRFLDIVDCKKFNNLSNGLKHLTALVTLRLVQVPALVDFPDGLQHLVSFVSLGLYGGGDVDDPVYSYKLSVLPETLQHAPSLEILSIGDCPNLTSLPNWLGNLTSLRSLEIRRCYNLSCLPDSIQNLTNLHTLCIKDCPELKKRCQKEIGEDWHKIAHVPHVEV